jgi:hypothetical protein
MERFYEKEIKISSTHLVKHFPEKRKLIQEAIKAHKKKLFFASTILFLSLADGICNGYLFRIANQKKKLKNALSDKRILDFVVSTLTNVSAIDAHTDDSLKYPSKLNRHAVMHGNDITYGTRTNSLKAFSLFACVADFVGKKLDEK